MKRRLVGLHLGLDQHARANSQHRFEAHIRKTRAQRIADLVSFGAYDQRANENREFRVEFRSKRYCAPHLRAAPHEILE